MENQNSRVGNVFSNIQLPTMKFEFDGTSLLQTGLTIFVSVSLALVINALVNKALR